MIDSGADLQRWSGNTKLVNARRAVLVKTRELLLAEQPPARRIARRFRQANDWDVGELVSYQTTSGKYVVLRVLGHHVDKGGKAPEVDLLDYFDAAPPVLETALTLPSRPLVEKNAAGYSLTRRCMVGATSAREIPADRLRRLGVSPLPPETAKRVGTRVLLWRPGRPVSLDTFIESVMPRPVIWHSGPGGDDHRSWEIGDVLAYKMPAGPHLLFQLIDRYHGDGIEGAPVVAVLDSFPESLPQIAEVPARPVTPYRTLEASLGFVLVNDGTDAVPASAVTRIGRHAPVVDQIVQLFASVPMAVQRVERLPSR